MNILEGEHIVLRKAKEDDYKSMLKNVWGIQRYTNGCYFSQH